MAEFKSEEVRMKASAEKVFEKLSNPMNLKSLLDKVPSEAIPEDKRAAFDQIELTEDSITIPGGPVGAVTLRRGSCVEPTLVKFVGEGTPVELSLALRIVPESEESCMAQTVIDIAIPAMLRPMVAGPLQKMADQFTSVLRAIPFS